MHICCSEIFINSVIQVKGLTKKKRSSGTLHDNLNIEFLSLFLRVHDIEVEFDFHQFNRFIKHDLQI